MNEWLICFFLLTGSFFTLAACIGIVKLPDLFTRMQATTKASSLGVSFLLIAAAICFPDPHTISLSLAIIVFIFLTAAVGAHMIARVAYVLKVPKWKGTVIDELDDYYQKSLYLDQLVAPFYYLLVFPLETNP